MKCTTPASRAPGVPSLGMICAEIASTSAASPERLAEGDQE